MNSVSPKVSAGAGAALGAPMPIVVIIIWLLSLAHVAMPPEVAVALGSIISGLCALAVGYYMPHDPQIAALLAGQQIPLPPNPTPAATPIPPSPPPPAPPPMVAPAVVAPAV